MKVRILRTAKDPPAYPAASIALTASLSEAVHGDRLKQNAVAEIWSDHHVHLDITFSQRLRISEAQHDAGSDKKGSVSRKRQTRSKAI